MKKKYVEGNLMYFPESLTGLSSYLWADKPYEPEFMWIMRKEASGKIALDIGANIGYSTIILGERMKQVIAFEPNYKTRKILLKNVEQNKNSKKIHIYKFALSNKNGFKIFYLSKHPNLSAFDKNKKYWFIKKKVGIRTMDSLKLKPNFIKMDIEGHEVEVIEGGMRSLKKTENCRILLEVHPDKYNKEKNFAKILNDLINIGYKFKYVVSAGHSPFYLFDQKGYKPFKMFESGKFNRGIYRDIATQDAIDFSTKLYGSGQKIVRSIMLEK
jgi:FkbM family methyltransferase